MNPNEPTNENDNKEEDFYLALLREDEGAFRRLYLETYTMCLPYALNNGSTQEEAEDLFHDCLAMFIANLRRGKFLFGKAKITTYFYQIYINQWKKAYKKKLKRGEVPLNPTKDYDPDADEESFKDKEENTSLSASVPNPDLGSMETVLLEDGSFDMFDEENREWMLNKLWRAISSISQECQDILYWFYAYDWSLREIAEELGITEGSATTKRYRCANYLRERFRRS